MLNIKEVRKFWQKQSKEDLKTAEIMFENSRYAPALFFCHLSLEKFLKSLVVRKTKDHAPFEHNLKYLAEKAGTELSGEDSDLLREINTFNIKGRYDDYKSKFYKMATKAYTKKYLGETKRIILWLKKQ